MWCTKSLKARPLSENCLKSLFADSEVWLLRQELGGSQCILLHYTTPRRSCQRETWQTWSREWAMKFELWAKKQTRRPNVLWWILLCVWRARDFFSLLQWMRHDTEPRADRLFPSDVIQRLQRGVRSRCNPFPRGKWCTLHTDESSYCRLGCASRRLVLRMLDRSARHKACDTCHTRRTTRRRGVWSQDARRAFISIVLRSVLLQTSPIQCRLMHLSNVSARIVLSSEPLSKQNCAILNCGGFSNRTCSAATLFRDFFWKTKTQFCTQDRRWAAWFQAWPDGSVHFMTFATCVRNANGCPFDRM